VVVVLLASKPLVLPASTAKAAAVIWAANPGMRGGRAIAELLTGAIEPSGRLPISFARHVGQQPTYYSQIRGQHGTRYADLTQAAGVEVRGRALVHDRGVLRARAGVLCARRGRHDHRGGDGGQHGSRPVRETVQVYVRDVVTSASWTDKELKAYRQVQLAPGESARVRLELPVGDCTIVDAEGSAASSPARSSSWSARPRVRRPCCRPRSRWWAEAGSDDSSGILAKGERGPDPLWLDDLVRTTADDTRFQPGALIWLAVATFSMGIDGYVLAGLLPQIATDLDVDAAAARQLMSVFAATGAIAGPVLGALTGRWERKSTIVLSLSVFVLGNLMVGLSPPTSGRARRPGGLGPRRRAAERRDRLLRHRAPPSSTVVARSRS
jgi:hypothetical protein